MIICKELATYLSVSADRFFMKLCDRLYGNIEVEEPAAKLLPCEKIARLCGVSLSAVPDAFMVPVHFSGMASRLEHSIGMAHLIEILCADRPEFMEQKNALIVSAICHDSGAPPFSHNTEHLLEEIAGMNHEQYTKHILKGSSAEDAIKDCGHSLGEIAGIINGKSVLGKIMNNSIDIDNMDNTERYGFSSGRVGRISDPLALAKAFMIRNGMLYLDGKYSEEVEKWKECRRRVYGEIVYSDANLSAGAMLRRALGFLYEAKGRDLMNDGFFMLSDSEALRYMEENSADAKALISMEREGRFHNKAAEIISAAPSERMKELCGNWKGGTEIADRVCEKFGFRRRDISVQAFVRKPERGVNFYPAQESGKAEQQAIFDIRVFANPEIDVDNGKVQAFASEIAEMRDNS